MRTPVYVAWLVAAALSVPVLAQDKPGPNKLGQDKPRAGEAGKPVKKDGVKPTPSKDDAVTAKDPVVVALDKFSKSKVNTKREGWRTSLAEPPKQTFDAARDYVWHVQTNHGELTVRLRSDVAPMHVTNVIYLTRIGFYDGLMFHRAIKGFMAQGGCPLGNGTGNPGYKMESACSAEAKHDKAGILSAANEGKPKTEGSQFFITYAPTPHLDGKHTVFGEVTNGLDVLKAFEERSGTNEPHQPTQKLLIERAWVTVTVKESEKAKAKAGK